MSLPSVGVIQHNPTPGDIAGNYKQIQRGITDIATEDDVDFIVSPEVSLYGYPANDYLYEDELYEQAVAQRKEIVAQTVETPPVVLGTVRRTDQRIWNSCLVAADGEVRAWYDKQLLPSYGVFDEDRYFAPGKTGQVVSINGYDVALSVCEDVWYDEEYLGVKQHSTNPLAAYREQSVDLLVNPSASPYRAGKHKERRSLLQDRAGEIGAPVLFVNRAGSIDEVIFDGRSMLASPNNYIELTDAFTADTGVLQATDSETVDTDGRTPHRDLRRALGVGTQEYVRRAGFDSVIVGLSGGIDSAVTACIAVDALGADNVTGVMLPSDVTSEESIVDAREVATRLGIAFTVIPVGEMVEAITEGMESEGSAVTGVAYENVQARIRGLVLMTLANQRGELVLTPDNKSESTVGYCTLYGDTVGALAPLGDVVKSDVYQLARSFNESPPTDAEEVIPERVVAKEPSAELREGQVDTDDLPSYDIIDTFVKETVEGTSTSDDVPEQAQNRLREALRQSEFKRNQFPPVLRITNRAYGVDWRYPITGR